MSSSEIVLPTYITQQITINVRVFPSIENMRSVLYVPTLLQLPVPRVTARVAWP